METQLEEPNSGQECPSFLCGMTPVKLRLVQLLTQVGTRHSTGSTPQVRTEHSPSRDGTNPVRKRPRNRGCQERVVTWSQPASSRRSFHYPLPRKNTLKTHPLYWTDHLWELFFLKHCLICHLNRKNVPFPNVYCFEWSISNYLCFLKQQSSNSLQAITNSM